MLFERLIPCMGKPVKSVRIGLEGVMDAADIDHFSVLKRLEECREVCMKKAIDGGHVGADIGCCGPIHRH